MTVNFAESCKNYEDFASKLTVIPNIHWMFRFWLVSFFGCVFFCVAFLMKFRYGNGGATENGNVTCGDPHHVSTMEDNNSRGKVFIIDGLMYRVLMLIIVWNHDYDRDVKFILCLSNCIVMAIATTLIMFDWHVF